MTAYQFTGSFALAMLCGAAGTAIDGHHEWRAHPREPIHRRVQIHRDTLQMRGQFRGTLCGKGFEVAPGAEQLARAGEQDRADVRVLDAAQ